MNTLILSLLVLCAPAAGAVPAGSYGNVTASPFTGDIWGTSLTLRTDGGVWSGQYRRAESPLPEQAITKIEYDAAAGVLRFHVKDDDKKDCLCAVRAVTGGVLFKLREASDEQWEYLRIGNVSSKDYSAGFITQEGAHLKKGASDDINPADIIAQIPAGEKVTLLVRDEDGLQNGYVRSLWAGKKGFIDQQFLWAAENQIVTGKNVRLRAKPGTDGTILDTLAEGTPVQVIRPIEGEWIGVIAAGKKGFIHYKFISR
jgi:hypothetical protein